MITNKYTSLLITGGAGFMGSNFANWVYMNHPETKITILDNLTEISSLKNIENILGDRAFFVKGDINDVNLVSELVSQNDAVIHFAAESHVDTSIQTPLPFIETNINGTYVLLEAVRKFDKRLHHVSTDEVFGSTELQDGPSFNEESPYNPSSPYSASKAASDLLVKAWIKTYGIKATISNSVNNYGPHQNPEKFIPKTITDVMKGNKPEIYGDGKNIRSWLYVDDHSQAVWKILTEGTVGETYNIGSPEDLSNLEVISVILNAMDKPQDYFVNVSDRPGHDLKYSLNSEKLIKELGWTPKYTDFVQNIHATIGWYLKNPGWWK